MHAMLKDAAMGEGEGSPAKLVVNHRVSVSGEDEDGRFYPLISR
jgi:hypothetical protein